MATDAAADNDAELAPEPGLLLAPVPTKRLRWATQHKKGKNANRTRSSILDRLNRRPSRMEKKRESGGTESLGGDNGDITEDPEEGEAQGEGEGQRKVHFNIPLPQDALDEDGSPKTTYPRNKIRTAKYTPLSFLPKNIWLQFHNIANVYFFILVILTVSFIRRVSFDSQLSKADFHHLRRNGPRTQRSSSDCHCVRHGDQGRNRRLQAVEPRR